MAYTKEQAWELLTQYNKGEFHLKHANTVADVMRWYAEKLGYGFAGFQTSDGKTITENSIVNGNAVVTAQWTATSYTGKTYTDVNKSDWFYNYVMELSEQGIVGGNGDGTFAPNRPTSTGEMLKLVLLSTGHKEQKPSTAHWASGYATYAYSMGFAAQNYSD